MERTDFPHTVLPVRPATRRAVGPLSVLLMLLVLLALPLVGCGTNADAGAESSPGAAPAAESPPAVTPGGAQAAAQAAAPPAPRGVNVEVTTIQPRDFVLTSTYVGNLAPERRVSLKSEREGMVEQVSFEEGSAVKKGQVLVNISTKELRVRRDQARASLQLAEQNLKRDQELYGKELIPRSQLDVTVNAREQARLTLQLAELELEKSVVQTPIAGQVKTRNVEPGEFINKGTLLAEVLDLSTVKAEVSVPEQDIRHLQLGRGVELSVDALPGKTYTGTVTQLGVEADERSRSFPVEVSVPNPRGDLLPGMLARVKIQIGVYRNQVLIPRHALLERSTGRVVYVARDGVAHEVHVETGESANGLVQVLKGLRPGEQLIVTGQQQLTQNDPITITGEQP